MLGKERKKAFVPKWDINYLNESLSPVLISGINVKQTDLFHSGRHSRKSTATNNINASFVVFKCSSQPWQCDSEPACTHLDPEPETAKLNSVTIYNIIYTWDFLQQNINMCLAKRLAQIIWRHFNTEGFTMVTNTRYVCSVTKGLSIKTNKNKRGSFYDIMK